MVNLDRSSLVIAFLTTGLLCLTVFISPAAGIKCFQCNSKVDEDCEGLSSKDLNSTYYKECDHFDEYEGKDPFCRKTKLTLANDDSRLVRSCGWRKYHLDCYKVEEVTYSEKVCQCFTDGCNPATKIHVAPILIAAATSIALLKVTL